MRTWVDVERQGRTAAMELEKVGIIPMVYTGDGVPHPEDQIGLVFEVAGQRFMKTSVATREEFLAAVERAGLMNESFQSVASAADWFLRVSTD